MPTNEELQKYWDDAIARWKSGGEHPLAKHPLAVRCDGYPGCYTIAPIRILPDYAKRYCFEHLPTENRGSGNALMTPFDRHFLRSLHVIADEENFRLEGLWLRWQDANTHRDFAPCDGCGVATGEQHTLDCPRGAAMVFPNRM